MRNRINRARALVGSQTKIGVALDRRLGGKMEPVSGDPLARRAP